MAGVVVDQLGATVAAPRRSSPQLVALRSLAARLAVASLQLVAVATVVFFATEALPGDAVASLAGADHSVDEQALRAQLALDGNVWQRYLTWCSDALQGDFGRSLHNGMPVTDIVRQAMPNTVVLAILATLILVPLTLAVGTVCAVRQGTALDRAVSAICFAAYSIPEFVVLTICIAAVSFWSLPLPPTGLGMDVLREPALLIIPVLVLIARPTCSLSRVVRAGMLEALKSGYAQHARRVGMDPATVIGRHCLPNAAPAALQQGARVFDHLLGGAIVIEMAYGLPGLGLVLHEAIKGRDLPVLQAVALMSAAVTVGLNALVDLAVQAMTPTSKVAAC